MPSIRELSAPTTSTTDLPPHASRLSSAGSPTKTEAPGAFSRLVAGFAHEADRGEATVHRVLEGGAGTMHLDPVSLLGLQAGIYRYGETMDLAARLVDKASTGVKTVLQGQ